MKAKEIKAFFSKEPEILYPYEVIESAKTISAQKVFPITSSINGHYIPGLFISCNSKIYNYFGIGQPPPSPNLKFRMVNFEEKNYAIEVLLYFAKNKVMRLHLNPFNTLTKHYLKAGIKNKIIAFHFYNKDNYDLIDSITNLDKEEFEWFKRNSKLSGKLKSNPKYSMLSTMIEEELMDKKNEKCFKFHATSNQKLLAENAVKFYKMEGAKYFFDTENQ